MGAKIIDRGRGPEIERTRMTVYDVMDYWKEDWRVEHIAAVCRLPIEDIEAAIDYIRGGGDAESAASDLRVSCVAPNGLTPPTRSRRWRGKMGQLSLFSN